MIETIALLAALSMPVLGAETPQKFTPNTAFTWKFDGTNTDGSACTDLDHFEVGLFLPDDTLVTAQPAQICGPQGAMQCELAFDWDGVSEMAYVVKVRSVDEAGNMSPWSTDTAEGVFDKTVPSMPTGVKVKVTVIVEIGQ